VEFNQSFLVPSIPKPKLSKRNISSSVLKGSDSAAKTLSSQKLKLKTSTFNFLKEKKSVQDITKNPQLIVDAEFISSSLVETNKILVEIQKQLELDFTNRIAEQNNLLKTARIQKEKQSRVRKEFSLEKFGGVAKKITGLFAPITKPVKSIFDKLKEFLGIILSGVILEKAFDWLSKKENREKISNIFNFLTKNWKLLVGLFIGAKVIGGLIKLITFIGRIKKALGFLGKGLGFGRGRRGGTTTTTKTKTQRRGGLLKDSTGRRRGFKTETTGRLQQRRDRYGRTAGLTEVYKTTKNPIAKALQKSDIAIQKIGKNLMKSMGMGPGAKGLSKLLRPIFKRIPVFGPLIDFAVSLALGEPLGRAAAKSIGAAVGGTLGSFLFPGAGTILGGVVGDLLGGSVYDMLVKPKEESEEGPPKMEKGGMIGGKLHSEGGTIIEAEKGEYIIDKINTQRYLPVLTSIKYQGGSSWDAFTNAVKLQENIIEEQFKTENKFTEFLDSLKDFYDEKYRKLLLTADSNLNTGTGQDGNSDTETYSDGMPSNSNTGTGQDGNFGTGTYGDGMPSNPNLRSVTSEAEIRDRKNYGNTVPEGSFGITPSVSETQRRRNASRSISSASVIPVSMPHKNLKTSSMYGKNGGMNFIELPPVVMNGESNLPKIPTFKPKEDSLNLPEISPFDHFNDYLNTSISYYDIEGIKFGGE
jgi:hypothetical protein